MKKLFLAVFSAFLIVGCGSSSGSTPLVQGSVSERGVAFNERAFHDEEKVLESGVVLALYLEHATDDHEGDIGIPGSDTVLVHYSESASRTFRLPADATGFEVRLRRPGGADLMVLTELSTEQTLEVPEGRYELEFRNLGSESVLIFVQAQGDVLRIDPAGLYLAGLDLGSANLSGRDFSRCDLRGTNLMFADCRQVNFSNADLRGALLSSADCQGARFLGAALQDAHFLGTNLTGATSVSTRSEQIQPQLIGTGFPTPVVVSAIETMTIKPGSPLLLTGGSRVLNLGTLRILSGGMIIVETAASIRVQELLVEDSSAAIIIRGQNGRDGRKGVDGTSVSAATSGGAGKDGTGYPDFTLFASSVPTGAITVDLQNGNGGNGGAGGLGGTVDLVGQPGAAGGNGGDGGSGGQVRIYTGESTSGLFQESYQVGNGGEGGPAGAGGGGAPAGQPGEPGRIGIPGSFSVVQVDGL